MGSQGWDCRVVSGQLQRPVLLEPEDPDTFRAPEGVRQPELYNVDAAQLSFACALEFDHLCWAAGGGLDQKFRAEQFLNDEILSFTRKGGSKECNSSRSDATARRCAA